MKEEWKKVLLVGNGINLLNQRNEYSWSDLLRKLKERATDPDAIDLNNEFKPFTLSFEEIAFAKTPDYHDSIKTLKETIKDHYSNMPSGPMHEPIMRSSFKHVITTNYEYSFEKVYVPDFQTNLDEYSDFKEEKSSLARKHFLQKHDRTVWHIHGEIDDHTYKNPSKHYTSKSILIGYEQYAYYLSRIQDYIYGNTKLTAKGLKKRLKKLNESQEFELYSWVDFFFIADIYIIGLSFDFSEIHLWWLLNKRNEMLRSDQDKNLVNNHITYYYMPHANRANVELGDQLGDLVKCKRQKAITDILSSMGVKCVPIRIYSYLDFYQDALQRSEGHD